MKKSVAVMIIGLFLMSSAIGCNMMKGAGEDVENVGENIQKTVDRND